MNGRAAWRVATFAVLAAGVAGCGLKGALEMPERSSNIVIRGPQPPEGSTGPAAPAEPTPAPETPAGSAEPSTTKVPADDRMPPPPLPGGNPGSARGG